MAPAAVCGRANDMKTFEVDPGERYFPTGIHVRPGERYTFQATGQWKDGDERCDHTGWIKPSYRWLTRFNRVKGEHFFRLCACIGKHDRHAFAINTDQPWQVAADVDTERDSQLYLFANDHPWMYWNNRALPASEGGPMHVTVTRLP